MCCAEHWKAHFTFHALSMFPNCVSSNCRHPLRIFTLSHISYSCIVICLGQFVLLLWIFFLGINLNYNFNQILLFQQNRKYIVSENKKSWISFVNNVPKINSWGLTHVFPFSTTSNKTKVIYLLIIILSLLFVRFFSPTFIQTQ